MDIPGLMSRRKMMDITKLIEELYSMMKRSQLAVCSITRTDFSSAELRLVRTLTQNTSLEEAIPLLFQADIDQYVLTDISTQQVSSCAGDAFNYYINYYINIRLTRCI